MAVLEKIRQRTTVLILIIGLALFAFVISGVFTNSGSGSPMGGSAIGSVNGEEISIDDFRQKLEVAAQRAGSQATTVQLVNQVWNSSLRTSLLNQEIEDLGISVEGDQIMNFIKNTPSYSNQPEFQDENGIFSESLFIAAVADWKANNPYRYSLWLQDELAIMQSAKEQMYFNLIKAGVGTTLEEGKFDYKLANDKVDISYVRMPFSAVPDTTITVTAGEIESYISKNPALFKQEPARDIRLVYFEEKASKEDEQAVKDAVVGLLSDTEEYNENTGTTEKVAGFLNTTDLGAFLERNSDTTYDTIFRAKNEIVSTFKDSIISLNPGQTFGPYKENNAYKVSKLVAKKNNGTVKASHILISFVGAERVSPTVTRTKEEARKEANRLLIEAKKSTTVFAELARDNSDGPTAPRGGDLGFFQEGQMTPKFNDFMFSNSVDAIGLVETEFGFHIVRVDDKQDIFQIATLSRDVAPSEQTINTIFTQATKFEMEVTENPKEYVGIAKEGNFDVRSVNKLLAMDENLPGLAAQRGVVQWAFNEDTDLGAIKRFNVNNGYAIVQLTARYRSGTMTVADASATALPILRKEKKAAWILKNKGGNTLESFAAASGQSVETASALSVKSPIIPGAGREAYVVGKAFNLTEGATSSLLVGETGVFLVQLNKEQEAVALDSYATYAEALKAGTQNSIFFSSYNALKETATIEDNRAVFY